MSRGSNLPQSAGTEAPGVDAASTTRGSLKYYQDARSNYKSALEAFRNMRLKNAASQAAVNGEFNHGDSNHVAAVNINTTITAPAVASESNETAQSGSPSVDSIIEELNAILRQHNPTSLASLDEKLKKYAGREHELLDMAKTKYLGLETAVSASGSSSTGGAKGAPYTGAYAFMDISINGETTSRMKFKLYDETTPLASNNFRMLCTGEKVRAFMLINRYFTYLRYIFILHLFAQGACKRTGARLSYQGSRIHRIVPGFVVQGGDITMGNGRGGVSVYAGTE